MNKLTRSKNDKVFSGVCGGIGEYFDIDSTIIRLGFVVLIFMSFGTAILVYFISSLVIPEDDGVIYHDSTDYNEDDNKEKYKRNEKIRNNTPIFIGLGLIVWGIFLLTKQIFPHIFHRMKYIWNYWPVLLILLGLYVIFQQKDN